MKREYIMPAINVVMVETSAILQSSNEKEYTPNGSTNTGFADARSFYFEEITEEE